MTLRALRWTLVALALCGAGGCDGQQYVAPATVALVITDDAKSAQVVNRCHYVPILLGSQVKARYEVDDELRATITVTRDDVRVAFEDGGDLVHAFRVESSRISAGERVVDEEPPAGYTVELSAGCTPDS